MRIKVRGGNAPKGKGRIFINRAPKPNLMRRNRKNLALTPRQQIKRIVDTLV